MRIPILFWLVLGLSVTLSPQGALAAPQILAVLATDNGVPLICDDGLCRADLSTFCLQRQRPSPDFGTAYVPAAPDAFALLVTDAEGKQTRLPTAGRVSFVQRRGFTAVSARLSRETLAELGAVSAAIEIGADASLVPVPRNGDPDPLTVQEIEVTVGPLRALGTRVVDASGKARAAGLLGVLINRLAPEGQAGAEAHAPPWREAMGALRMPAVADPGLSRARTEYNWCADAIEARREFRLRGCLERRHDSLMRDLSNDYWDAIAGS